MSKPTAGANATSAADPTPADDGEVAPPPKGPLAPNAGKSLTIEVEGTRWARVPIQTALFARGDQIVEKVVAYATQTVECAGASAEFAGAFIEPWYVVVSEKIVAISQGRSYFTWEINPGASARFLSRLVQRTPHGIGLGSPWTMQLAINEAGLPRILLAAAASVVGKAIGRRGWFYVVAGHRVNAIDGPTSYSAFPSNVSAKLPPKDPDKVAADITATLRSALPPGPAQTLAGTVIIDSNDLGRDVLGHDTDRLPSFFCELFRDNPFGQGRQQTPVAVCVRLPL
ncbi:coenzyme F420-0:L-glutamate ligase [Actinopolymorpha alba]|uniref:coenzyme F420-0:L-glutamate ligase n=1 Tax=Actinopolymorpha alba TaxID=533267 RepID=UPI000362E174|nr:coenzyme F420-0:L-glutamate ligase [Actinopolymorpha alba]